MSLKSFVNNLKDWEEFNQYVDSLIELRRVTLETATDETTIKRMQGRIQELRGLKQMREILNAR